MPPDIAGATFMAAGSSGPELATAIIGVFVAKVFITQHSNLTLTYSMSCQTHNRYNKCFVLIILCINIHLLVLL